jgi:hypothetical protein
LKQPDEGRILAVSKEQKVSDLVVIGVARSAPMRRFPAEPEPPPLLGWFLACLLLSVVVAGAFVAYGDVSVRSPARMVVLPPAKVTTAARRAAVDCPAKVTTARSPCLPDQIQTGSIVQR